MKLYLKYFKQYWKNILLIVVLVACQVSTMLALPKYMAKMINVGIQQKGIETYVYPALSKNRYALLVGLSTKQEQVVLSNAYQLEGEYYALKNNSADLEKITIHKNNAIVKMASEKNEEMLKNIMMMNDTQKQSALQRYELIKMDTMAQVIQSNMIYQESKALGLKDASTTYIMKKGFEMLLVAVSGMLFVIGAAYASSKFSAKVAKDLRKQLFTKIQSFSEREFNQFSTASLITRTINDTNQIQNMVGMCLRIGLMSPLVAIGAFIQSSSTNVSLMWTIVVGVICFVILMVFVFSQLLPRFVKARKILDKINLILRENLSGLRVIRAFNTEAIQSQQFKEVNDEMYENNIAITKVIALVNPGLTFITNMVAVLIVFFGSQLIVNSTMQIGDLLSFIQFATQIMFGFMMFGFLFFMIPQISIALKRIDDVLIVSNTIEEVNTSLPYQDQGIVEFKDVTFAYDDTSLPAIENLSFKATPGKVIAFIGGTGSGKSTIGKLINRFYDASQGQVLVNGVDVKSYSLSDLRALIGYVPQIGQVFSMKVKENIAYGFETIDEDKVKLAADIACATPFILEKPNQFEEVIEQRGANLSGGQKQRLQIARAIYKDTKILFFDDSFSALDYKTDVQLRANLYRERKDATIIIVAQRIPTIMHADEIIVLDDGKVVGRGTHAQLLESCTVYQDIAESQLEEGK